MELPDLTNLPLSALLTYLILIAAVDVAFNTVLAIARSQFSPAYILEYLRTHILLRVFVIGALGVVGHGIPALEVPAIPAISAATSISLGLYIVETIASLRGAITTTAPS